MAIKNIKFSDIKFLYEEGKTPSQISEILGCTISNISRRLKKNGFNVVRDYSKTRYSRKGRYALNENMFSVIDSENLAYFYGLLLSDGSLTENRVVLKLTDLELLELIRDKFNIESPIRKAPKYKDNHKQSYILSMHSKAIVLNLNRLGCYINKTKTQIFPQLDFEYYPHFLEDILMEMGMYLI